MSKDKFEKSGRYLSNEYATSNPTWHAEDSP